MLLSGHEQDARVLQQQWAALVTEQHAAAQYVLDNLPVQADQSQPAGQQQQQKQQMQHATHVAALEQVHWKFDILRAT